MLISIHAELKTKFVHAQELKLRLDGYKHYQINLNIVDKEVNQQENAAIDALLNDLHAVNLEQLMDVMPVALDAEAHDIILIDIYDLPVDSFDAVKEIFKKHAKNLCADLPLWFDETPDDSEFQLSITQVEA